MAELQRVKAIVAYDGTAYQGFQVQPQVPTIQGALEKALDAVTHEGRRVVGSGRTDAGVHAQGQVVHMDTAWRHGLAVLQRAWNANLPADIVIRRLERAPADFHARFDAISREYRYSIYRAPLANPLMGRYTHHYAGDLDLVAMSAAACALCGERDFAAFGTPPQGNNTVRLVHRAVLESAGDILHFYVTGNAFLRRMVRLIVGTLLLVGSGRLTPDQFAALVQAGDINHPVAAVPPCGLCLVRVNYLGPGRSRVFEGKE